MAAATMLAARQSKQLESGQQETYSIVTLINCRKFLEPVLDDHNVGESPVTAASISEQVLGCWCIQIS
jgi:hypothetical protein